MTRVGIAGYAMAGRDFHAPLLRAAGFEVAAVATSHPERSAAARGDNPGAVIVPDLEALLDVDGLDLLVLATPTGLHADHALRVIEAGIPLVVDKPLSVTAESALEVVDAAERAGVPLSVFHNRRYDPEHTTLTEVLRSGTIGEVYRAEMRWERWRPEPKHRWREDVSSLEGGGIMLDLHSHLIDAAVLLFGDVQTVYAEIASHTTTADDDVFLACRHTSGTVSHLGAMAVAAAPGPRFRILGSTGAYLLGELDGIPSIFADLRDEEGCAGWIYRGAEREPVPAQQSSPVAFYEAVLGALQADHPQEAMPVDPRDAVHTAAVIDAARLSAEGERVVEVITPGRSPSG